MDVGKGLYEANRLFIPDTSTYENRALRGKRFARTPGDAIAMRSKTLESINTSQWQEANDFDFAGGDETAYHTGWKSYTIDVSAYQNKIVNLQFTVYDVGDQVYDSAVLLDNVHLS